MPPLAAALQADVARGLLAPGAKLPTHRRLAELLGVGVGAVTKAYAAAEDRGLVTAHVGRGSFIAQPAARGADVASHQGPIDLAHNLPPAAPARARLAEALGRLRQRGDLLTYLDYPPTAGAEAHHLLLAIDDLEREIGPHAHHDHVERVGADVDGGDPHHA